VRISLTGKVVKVSISERSADLGEMKNCGAILRLVSDLSDLRKGEENRRSADASLLHPEVLPDFFGFQREFSD
jgi:hypothetical protein